MKNHNFKYKNIVIGNSVAALLYAFKNDYVVIFNANNKPSSFDFFPPSYNFEKINLASAQISFMSNVGEVLMGYPKLHIWQHLCYTMSLSGQIPFSDRVTSIRVVGKEKVLKVFSERSKMFRVEFDELHIFDSENVEGVEKMEPESRIYRVEDKISVRSGCKHDLDYLKYKNNFVKEIFFYPSDRIEGNHTNIKALVAISYLTEDQLGDINYSDTYVRMYVKKKMEEAGIGGAKNGKNPNYPASSPEPFKYLSVKLENFSREIQKTKPIMSKTSEYSRFMNVDVEYLLKDEKICDNAYLYNVSNKIYMKDLLIR